MVARGADKITAEQNDFAERLVQAATGFASQGSTYSIAVPLSEAADRVIGDDAHLIRASIDLQLKLGNRDKAFAPCSPSFARSIRVMNSRRRRQSI
ncbi:MAG: hypothetical protein QM811_19155 [Pirellulales bacterium]